jgi:periodic tryptophan protein 1
MAWDPFEPYYLYCTLEDGSVVAWDMRSAGSKGPLYTFQAHDQTASSISFCPSISGMFATSSVDKSIKVWDARNTAATGVPHLVAYKTMNVGKLFAMQFSHDVPYLMVSGGDDGSVAIWESDEMAHIKNYFSSRENGGSTGGLSRVIESMNLGTGEPSATSSGSGSKDKKAKKPKNNK